LIPQLVLEKSLKIYVIENKKHQQNIAYSPSGLLSLAGVVKSTK